MEINVNVTLNLSEDTANTLKGLATSVLMCKADAYKYSKMAEAVMNGEDPEEGTTTPAPTPKKPRQKKAKVMEIDKPDPKEIDNEPAPMDDLPFGTGDPEGYVRESDEAEPPHTEPDAPETTAPVITPEATAKAEEHDAKVAEEKKAEENTPESSAQDVREAMERIRIKFGDDKNKADNDIALHKSLTACFKAIAQDMGYEKPSAIDDGKKRWEYIASLDNIVVNGSDATPF